MIRLALPKASLRSAISSHLPTLPSRQRSWGGVEKVPGGGKLARAL